MIQFLCDPSLLTLGFGGDLMIGRLVDAYLSRHPSFSIWGDLQPLLLKADFNIVNLETALTHSQRICPKVFNFKASPEKVSTLLQAPVHAVNLANNHTLDFSEEGLLETIATLDKAGILHVGAGCDAAHARAPVILEKKGIKIGLLGCTDNEPSWEAGPHHPGTYFVRIGDLEALRETITSLRKQVDFLILSIHWGPNMRKRPLPEHRTFAHQLIDLGVDLIHGHSAHLFQGMEIYRGKVILYDTGDLVDDYAVDPSLRNDRSFFFFVEIDQKSWRRIHLVPTLISRFQVGIAQGRESEEMIAEMKQLSQEMHTSLQREEGMLIASL